MHGPERQMRRQGFTIFELVVLVAVIGGCAALVYPVVRSETVRGRRAVAEEQCRQIAVGLERFLADREGQRERIPTDPRSGKRLTWLRGPGELPASIPFAEGRKAGSIDRVLRERDPHAAVWKGPYAEIVSPDPWGNALLVNLDGMVNRDEFTWIVSAGPNGIVDTPANSDDIRGDDIGRILPRP